MGLDESFTERFPHELSGGQLQRVCIARAIACRPEVILFDEAISSLDAHTQVQVMDLLRELKEKLGLTYIFITHDLTSVTYLCDEVLFLYKGRVTEHIQMCIRDRCMALLAGCGGGSETSGTGTAVSEEQGTRPREEAGAKDELVFVNYRDIRDLNPHLYAGEMYAQEMLFETLVNITERCV